jgi:hypothetical protein
VEALIDVSKTDKARTVNKLDESVQLAGNAKLQVKPTVENVDSRQKAREEVIRNMLEERQKQRDKEYEKICKKAEEEEVRQIAEIEAKYEHIDGEYKKMLKKQEELDAREAKLRRNRDL